MLSFFWNARGINDLNKHQCFRSWRLKNKPFIGCLVETHVLEPNAPSVIASILPGWRMESNYQYSHIGKLWLVWDPAISLVMYKKSLQQITCGVFLAESCRSFTITFVYASNLRAVRRDLWAEIHDIGRNQNLVNSPWLVVGDFNQTLVASDHSLRDEFETVSPGSREMQHCLNDHDACCFRIPNLAPKPKRPFKFNLHLIHHPEFLSIVEEAWRGFRVVGSSMQQTTRHIPIYRRELLKLWRVSSFLNKSFSLARQPLLRRENF
ncbi:unnamed protein product [Arabis nemorensis]|uniref:Endonuclease/exonuclease/phosphatase domain-containing protein n=1 Tax=Arabis nemorensis TaxID=586526 RepID=A0A565BV38_9BRAS|nr:unnamed protein product [Arabis nemorensis]